MNKYKYIMLIFTILTLLNCKSKNHEIKKIASTNDEMKLIIQDYKRSMKTYFYKYECFRIEIKNKKDKKIKIYSIYPENDNFIYKLKLNDSSLYRLPTNCYIENNKLFLWRENKDLKTPESLFNLLYSKNLIDSSYVKYQQGKIPESEIKDYVIVIDESLKGMNYIFCKENPSGFIKKIKTEKYIDVNDNIIKKIKCK